MTDPSPGPGWWLASDGNWYPPHLHPDAQAPQTPGRRSESDDELLAAFRVREPAADAAPRTSPIDEIRATTGGGIDWEAVARERAAAREARTKQASGARRRVLAVAAGVVALGVIFLATRGGGDGDDRTVTTPGSSTTAAPITATTAPATSAATAPTTTVAGAPLTTVVGAGATSAATAPTTTANRATGATGTSVSVFSLQPGSCIDQDNLTTGLVTTVRTIACDQPHTHEVYFRTSVTPADAAYDAAKVTAFANQACTDGFKTYVGIAYEQSKYYFVHLAPSAESWNKNRDRDVVCLLLLEGQKLTSSVKGKGE